MKVLQKIAAVSLLVATAPAAMAGGSGQGTIRPDWNVYGDGNLFFYLSGTHSGSPCSIPDRWAIDTTAPAGKSQYAAFLVAYMTGKALVIYGAGTCAHSNTEIVLDLHVSN